MSIDTYQLGDTLRMDFVVSDPADGTAIDADALPDMEIYEDGGTTAMATPTPAKRDTGTTGQYTFSQALTTGNSFEVGKTYTVYALATVGGTAGAVVVGQFRIAPVAVYAQ